MFSPTRIANAVLMTIAELKPFTLNRLADQLTLGMSKALAGLEKGSERIVAAVNPLVMCADRIVYRPDGTKHPAWTYKRPHDP